MTVTAGTTHVVLVAASRWWRRIIHNFTAVASEDRQTGNSVKNLSHCAQIFIDKSSFYRY